MAGLLGEFDALVDGGAGGNAVHAQNLECAEAQGDQDFRLEFSFGPGEQGLHLMVEANLPAKHAQNQRRGQVAIGGGERVDGFAAEQVVRMRIAALDGHAGRRTRPCGPVKAR